MQIFFICTKGNRLTIDRYLSLWGNIHFWNILPISYESLITKKKFPKGLYIFSDLELLQNHIRQQAIRIHHQISEQGSQTLNHPGVSLTRFPLLKTLYNQELNDFNIFRATEDYSAIRYPVFLRKTDNHKGPQSALLTSPKEVHDALARLQAKKENLQEWVITEYCDTSDANGLFRKYATFIVGSTLIPRHLFFDTSWVQKTAVMTDQPSYLQEEQTFQHTHLFQDQLSSIFRIARINYGRIDFGVVGGKVQTWEINTNPAILTPDHVVDTPRHTIHRHFFQNFSSTLQTYINDPTPSPPIWTFFSNRSTSVLHWLYQRSRHNTLTASLKKTTHALFR